LKDRFALDVRFEVADLYGLVGGERDAAVHAIAAGRDMPYVLVADEVICAGDLDIDRVAEALRNA
jgi:ABC-type microcin C transport system duplicated ATPase subunit YejF